MNKQIQHTAGPWTAAADSSKEDTIVITAPEVGYISEITRDDGLDERDWADARLIAAAPTMLEALQDVIDYLELRALPELDARYQPEAGQLERWKAAIAAATGK